MVLIVKRKHFISDGISNFDETRQNLELSCRHVESQQPTRIDD